MIGLACFWETHTKCIPVGKDSISWDEFWVAVYEVDTAFKIEIESGIHFLYIKGTDYFQTKIFLKKKIFINLQTMSGHKFSPFIYGKGTIIY